MNEDFRMDNLPFSLLDEAERQLVLNSLDLVYFQQGEKIIEAGKAPEGIYIIFKGRVRETEGDTEDQHIYVHYENEDYFGSWSAMRGQAIHDFIAEQETLCHLLPTKILFELLQSNALFADYFQQNLSAKREIVAQHGEGQDMAEFMLSKISAATIREPLIVEEGTTLHDATSRMREHKADCVLVSRGSRYGMVTKTDLLDAIVINGVALDTDVAEIASYRLVTADPDDYLFNALVQMTQQQIERVVIMRGQTLEGVVELTDILSYFSSHSHVIGLRIERANTIAALREAAHGLNDLIKALLSSGVKIRFTMDLLAAMNGRLIAKLFDLTIPADMQPHVCLIVMGSEGRGEQIMKTDQDNALLFRDGLGWPQMQATMQAFSEQLISFGFPPCPGNIMVSNPQWVNSVGDWTQKLSDWADSGQGLDQMNLAIAVDAKPVAGNSALFKVARNWFLRHLKSNDVFFSHFAKAAVEFATPLTFFGNLRDKDQLDIKKGGIFPIVHGVRTLALEYRVLETNTFRRIDALVAGGQLRAEQGDELAEALSLFIQLRLRQQIKRTDASADNQDETPNLLDLRDMNKTERELLREALQVVKEFKKHLSLRYHLGG